MARYTSLKRKRLPLEVLIEFYIATYPDIFKLGFICYPDPKKGRSGFQSETDKVVIIDPLYDCWKLGDNEINFLELWEIEKFRSSSKRRWIEHLEEEFQKRDDENIGLLSFVFTPRQPEDPLSTGWKHIPMIDFQCSINEANQRRVLEFLAAIGEGSGFLLESGKSYHYYSDNLASEAEWKAFTERLKQSQLVGETWPALQLGNRFSILRITTSKTKPTIPTIIGIIGDRIILEEGKFLREKPLRS